MGNLRIFGRRRLVAAAMLAAMQLSVFPAVAAQPAPFDAGEAAAAASGTTLAMTPGAPPPEVAAEADRGILAGMLLIVFAGMAGVTLVMWRDLAKRMKD